MLSSDTEQMTHGSLGFQEKSEIFAVCPPWMNWRKAQKDKLACCRERSSRELAAFVATDQKLRRSVLSILRWLLLTDLAEVPHVEPPVSAAGGQDGFVMGRPLNLLREEE